MKYDEGSLDGAQQALTRMRKAYDKGKGCFLTAAMIQSLNLTVFAETWAEADPTEADYL